MVAGGELGELRLVNVEYVQDWLTQAVDNKQAEWRTDPARSGAGGSTGDIGTHAFNLANFVTGLTLDTLAADLTAFVPGRRVDDNGHVLMRYKGGARGMLWCSQVAPGNENGLRLRVYGTKGGLEWAQEDPNYLWFTPFGQEKRKITRGGAGSGSAAARVTRVPPGHPEGYLEGFATIYTEAARAIRASKTGTPVPAGTSFPGLKERLEGVAFVDACVRSSRRNAAWVKPAL
jgi:predicted dehydrogenase